MLNSIPISWLYTLITCIKVSSSFFIFCKYHVQEIIIIILLLENFLHQRYLMVSPWSLSGSKSPQVSRTLLSIQADLNNAVVWTVSTRPVIPKSCCLYTNTLMTVTRAPIKNVIIVTFMFHRFFNSLATSRYFSLFSYFFNFTLWFAGTPKFTSLHVASFFI